MTLLAVAAPPHPLATTNAVLNAVAALLLAAGWVFILRGHWRAHRVAMVAAFATSAVFLVSYLTYHWLEGSRKYAGPESLRAAYYVILVTHVLLAAAAVLPQRPHLRRVSPHQSARRSLSRRLPFWDSSVRHQGQLPNRRRMHCRHLDNEHRLRLVPRLQRGKRLDDEVGGALIRLSAPAANV